MKPLPEVSSAVFVKRGKKRKLAAIIRIKHCNWNCGELLAVDTLIKAENFLKRELRKAGFKTVKRQDG